MAEKHMQIPTNLIKAVTNVTVQIATKKRRV